MKKAFAKIWQLLFVLILLFLGVYAERSGFVAYVTDPFEYEYIWELFLQHCSIVAVSMAIATLIGVLVGVLFTRPRLKRYAGVCMYIVGLGQTIPSLAVLALCMSFMGIGFKPAVFALTIYSILPIARNTLAGINAVPPALINAARGMGMPGWRILWEVELPCAMAVILTGFRVAVVINVGTVALAYLVGAGGMGDLIFTGIDLMQAEKLLAGAIPVTLLALILDWCCEMLSLVLVSRGLRLKQQS